MLLEAGWKGLFCSRGLVASLAFFCHVICRDCIYAISSEWSIIPCGEAHLRVGFSCAWLGCRAQQSWNESQSLSETATLTHIFFQSEFYPKVGPNLNFALAAEGQLAYWCTSRRYRKGCPYNMTTGIRNKKAYTVGSRRIISFRANKYL